MKGSESEARKRRIWRRKGRRIKRSRRGSEGFGGEKNEGFGESDKGAKQLEEEEGELKV